MKPKNVFAAALALLGGAVGFGLRRWQLATGFESDTGLAIPGTVAAWALLGWSALMALLFLVLVRPGKGQPQPTLAAGENNQLSLTVTLLAAVLLLVSAGGEAVTYLVSGQTAAAAADTLLAKAAGAILPPLRVLLCAGGVFAAGIWGRAVYRGGRTGQNESLALLEVTVLFCVWLLSDYQVRAADPVVMDYLYEILAITASLLALYYLAGYSFHSFKPGRCLFFHLLGIYLSLVTLADSHAFAEFFRYGFAVLFLSAHAILFLSEPAAPADQPAPAPDIETEVDDHA